MAIDLLGTPASQVQVTVNEFAIELSMPRVGEMQTNYYKKTSCQWCNGRYVLEVLCLSDLEICACDLSQNLIGFPLLQNCRQLS